MEPKFQVNGRRVHPKHCVKLHSADGYVYQLRADVNMPTPGGQPTLAHSYDWTK
jgi:hypothetical protein